MADTPAGSHAHAYTAPQAPDSAVTRGQFLSLTTVGLGAMIGAVIGVPATAYVLAPVLDEVAFTPVSLGPIDTFTGEQDFSPTAATFVEDAAQPETSANLAWVHYTGKDNQDWLASDAMFVVFSNRCMHLGCPVVASKIGFGCPCHGGQYDSDGARTEGPPIRPLDRFEWKVEKNELVLTNRWSVDFVDGKLTYFPVKMPGQPVVVPGPGVVQDHVPDILYPNVTYKHGPVPKAK
ncbi:MAG: menaquinol-cytochrome c reductase iron-sulfur subunit [Gaiellales bacterium]|nr:menaquinol-cytochrome c reductase iron-sulfur subunit [Gaiellales bacterium]